MDSILVIDSDAAPRAALVHALAALGEVDQAATGVDALRLLATKKFTIILLDLHVRPLDGFVILRTLAGRGGPNKETPVYAIAADAAEQARALREHAVFALTKPVSLPTVATLVEAGLRKSAAPARDRSEKSPSTPPVKTKTLPPTGDGSAPSRSSQVPAVRESIPAPAANRSSPIPAVKESLIPAANTSSQIPAVKESAPIPAVKPSAPIPAARSSSPIPAASAIASSTAKPSPVPPPPSPSSPSSPGGAPDKPAP